MSGSESGYEEVDDNEQLQPYIQPVVYHANRHLIGVNLHPEEDQDAEIEHHPEIENPAEVDRHPEIHPRQEVQLDKNVEDPQNQPSCSFHSNYVPKNMLITKEIIDKGVPLFNEPLISHSKGEIKQSKLIKKGLRKRIESDSFIKTQKFLNQEKREIEINNIVKSYFWNDNIFDGKLDPPDINSFESDNSPLYREAKRRIDNNEKIDQKFKKFSRNFTNFPPNFIDLCFHCKQYGHQKRDCQNDFVYVLMCFNCGGKGHNSAKCEKQKYRLDVIPNYTNTENVLNRYATSVAETMFPPYSETENSSDSDAGYDENRDAKNRKLNDSEILYRHDGQIYTKKSFLDKKNDKLYNISLEKSKKCYMKVFILPKNQF